MPKTTERAERGGSKARSVCTFCDALVSPYPEPDRCPLCRREVERVIPVSGLLSDEVVERVTRGRHPLFSSYTAEAQANALFETSSTIQTAIEQVGGAK